MREAAWLLSCAIPATIGIGCVVITEKPADSSPPAATATGAAAATATAPGLAGDGPALPSPGAPEHQHRGPGVEPTAKRAMSPFPPSETHSADAGVAAPALPTSIAPGLPPTIPPP